MEGLNNASWQAFVNSGTLEGFYSGAFASIFAAWAPSIPRFQVRRPLWAHCPLGQAASSLWARVRLESPSSRARRSVFLAKPRYRTPDGTRGQALGVVEYPLHVPEGMFHFGSHRCPDLLHQRCPTVRFQVFTLSQLQIHLPPYRQSLVLLPFLHPSVSSISPYLGFLRRSAGGPPGSRHTRWLG